MHTYSLELSTNTQKLDYPPETKVQQEPQNEIDTFVNKASNDDLSFLKKVYNYVRVLGLVKNQVQFSQIFLCKSPDYYSLLQSTKREVSINILHNIINQLEEEQEKELNACKRNNLHKLIEEGKGFIAKKILKYM